MTNRVRVEDEFGEKTLSLEESCETHRTRIARITRVTRITRITRVTRRCRSSWWTQSTNRVWDPVQMKIHAYPTHPKRCKPKKQDSYENACNYEQKLCWWVLFHTQQECHTPRPLKVNSQVQNILRIKDSQPKDRKHLACNENCEHFTQGTNTKRSLHV